MSAESSYRRPDVDEHLSTPRAVSTKSEKGQELRRTRSRVLRDFISRPDVRSTADLVRVYNNEENDEERKPLEHWIQLYIEWFEENINRTVIRDAVEEYIILFDIRTEHSESKKLKQMAFAALCERLSEKKFEENESNSALTTILQKIEPEVFEGNPTGLLHLADNFLKVLDPRRNIFSRSTYETHFPKLLAVRRLLLIVQEVAPECLDPQGNNNVYSTLKSYLTDIKQCHTYFPIFFEVQLIDQILVRLAQNTDAELAREIRRLLLAVSGCAYAFQGIRSFLFAGFDISSFEKAYERLKEAMEERRPEKKSWYDCLLELEAARMLLFGNDGRHDAFMECYQKAMDHEESLKDGDDRWLLRYGIIHQLLSVALHGSPESKGDACTELMYLATRYLECEGWRDKPEIVEALYSALSEVHERGEHRDKSEPALEMMDLKAESEEKVGISRMILVSETVVQGGIPKCLKTPAVAQSQSSSAEERRSSMDSLFSIVCRKIGKVYTNDAVLEKKTKLREKYTADDFAKVQLLSDESAKNHVKDLNHHLVVYEQSQINKDVSRTERREADGDYVSASYERRSTSKKPITIDNILLGHGNDSMKQTVSSVLLIGDPGTGKTSISKKIAYMWATTQWGTNVEALYVIFLRNIHENDYKHSGIRSERTLETVIANECFSWMQDEEFQTLRQQIVDDLDKTTTVLVLDGFDEADVCGKEMVAIASRVKAMLFLTSRPYNKGENPLSFDHTVECLGLSDKQLVHFIRNQMTRDEGERFIRGLKTSGSWGIAHVPVTAQIMCRLWKQRQEGDPRTNFRSIHTLYTRMVIDVWQRYVEKSGNQGIKRSNVFEALGEIAFAATKEGQVLIKRSLVRKLIDKETIKTAIKKSGLLLLRMEGEQYQFPHLTFQEYFTGVQLAHYLLQEGKEFIALTFVDKNKYSKRYKLVLFFMMHEVCFYKPCEGFSIMMKALRRQPKEVAGMQHLALELKLLEAFLATKEALEYHESSAHDISMRLVKRVDTLTRICVEDGRVLEVSKQELQACPRVFEFSLSLFQCLVDGCEPANEECRRLLLIKLVANLGAKSDALLPKVMDFLPQLLFDKRRRIRFEAVNSIGNIAKSRPDVSKDVLEILKGVCQRDDDVLHARALETVGDISRSGEGSTPEMLPMIVEGCKGLDSSVRQSAFSIIETLAHAPAGVSAEVLEILDRGLEDIDGDVCEKALAAIGSVAKCHPEHTDAMLEKLLKAGRSTNRQIRGHAFVVMADVARVEHRLREMILAAFVKLSTDDDENVRVRALVALGDVAKSHPRLPASAERVLLEGCRDEDFYVQLRSTESIGKIVRSLPEPTGGLLDALAAGCNNPDEDVRKQAFDAIGAVAISRPDLSQAVLRLLDSIYASQNAQTRIHAFDVLKNSTEACADVSNDIFDFFLKGCLDAEPLVRRHAFVAICDIAKSPARAPDGFLEKLIELCQAEDSYVREDTIRAMGDIAQTNPQFWDDIKGTIFSACQDEDRYVCNRALAGMCKVAKTYPRLCESASQLLSQCYLDGSEYVRRQIFNCLGDIAKSQTEMSAKVINTFAQRFSESELQNTIPVSALIFGLLDVPTEQSEKMVEMFEVAGQQSGTQSQQRTLATIAKVLKILPDVQPTMFDILQVGTPLPEWSFQRAALYALAEVAKRNPTLKADVAAVFPEGTHRHRVETRAQMLSEIGHAFLDMDALVALARGEAPDALRQGFQDPQPEVRAQAIAVIGPTFLAMTPKARREALDALRQGFRDPQPEVRAQALRTFSVMQKSNFQMPKDYLGDLLEDFVDCGHGEYLTALWVVKTCPAFSEDVVMKMLAVCRSSDLSFRRNALLAVGEFAKTRQELSETVAQTLIPLCGDADKKLREDALDTLGDIGDSIRKLFDSVLAMLVGGIKDEDPYVRDRSFSRLSSLAKSQHARSREVLEALSKCYRDPNQDVRSQASDAISDIWLSRPGLSREVLKTISGICHDSDPYTQEQAFRDIERLLSLRLDLFERVMGSLGVLCRDESGNVRELAFHTVVNVARSHPDLAEDVFKVLSNISHDSIKSAVRLEALAAIADVSESRSEVSVIALETLLAGLHDDDLRIREKSFDALRRLPLHEVLRVGVSSRILSCARFIARLALTTPLIVREVHRPLEQPRLKLEFHDAYEPYELEESEEAVNLFVSAIKKEIAEQYPELSCLLESICEACD